MTLVEHERPDPVTLVRRSLTGTRVQGLDVGPGDVLVELRDPDGGIWRLGTGGSDWTLFRRGLIIIESTDNESRVPRFYEEAVGRLVTRVKVGVNDRPGIQLDLEDDRQLVVLKSPEEVGYDLPIWEVWTPDDRVIFAHRDGSFDDVPDDVPIPELIKGGRLHHWPDPD